MRNTVKVPQNRITQGTIFSGVRSPYCDNSICYGICITARCDTARDFKAPRLTFLSVVPIEEWLWFESLPKVIENQKKASLSALRMHLKEKFKTTIVLDAFGADTAFAAADASDKNIKKHRKYFDEAMEAEKLTSISWKSLPVSISKMLNSEAQQLISGKSQDFYFLDAIEANYGKSIPNKIEGYIVLMRDIRTVSRNVALKLLDGIDIDKFKEIVKTDATINQLNMNIESFAIPTGELTSPYIEQLMQNFSILFGRIGTKEVPEIYAESVSQLLGVPN